MRKSLLKFLFIAIALVSVNEISGQTAPVVSVYNPLQNATGVPVGHVFRLTFDIAITPRVSLTATAYNYIRVYNSSNVLQRDYLCSGSTFQIFNTATEEYEVTTEVYIENTNVLAIDLPFDLQENTGYYIVIGNRAIYSTLGTTTAHAYVGIDNSTTIWSFITYNSIQPPSPTVYSPANLAVNVGITQALVLTFNENIALGTSGLLRIKKYADNGSFDLFDNTSTAISVSGATLTIYPHSDFVENTKYYVTMDAGFVKSASSGANFGGISSKDTWAFTSETVRIWKGSAGSDWFNVDNWVGGLIFVDNSTLQIPDGVHQPLVTTNIITNDLIIGAEGGITISSAGNITVNGKLELQSSTSDNADFACSGGLVYTPNKVKIYQHIDYNARTYHVASPVIDATQTSIGCDLGMYQWNTSTGLYELYSPSAVMEAAQGFALRSNNNLLFTGSIQTGDVIKNVSRTATNAGWNFVGNPYPCAIEMTKVARSTEVLESFWVYNSLATTYGTINGFSGAYTNSVTGTKIPSNHAFWTQVKPTFSSGTLTFSNTSKAFADGSFLKAASIEPVYYNLRLACGNGTVNDEFLISFAAESTDGYDRYDSEKKFSTNAAIAQPFMSVGGKNLVINSYPKLENELIVPVTLRVGTAGAYTFERISIENFEESVGMFLIDLQENQTIDLRNVQSYPFNATSTGDLSGRFVVKFVGTIATSEQSVENVIKPEIGVADNKISITFADDSAADVKVFTLDGKCVNESKVFGGVGVVDVESNGIYILKIVSTNGVFTQKILIQ